MPENFFRPFLIKGKVTNLFSNEIWIQEKSYNLIVENKYCSLKTFGNSPNKDITRKIEIRSKIFISLTILS